MLNKGNFLLCLGLLLSLVDCQCSDNLQSIAALARLEMCDRGSACGCNELPDEGASIDFGTPTAGEVAFRTLRIANDNAPFELRLINLELNDSTGIFSLVRLQRLSEDSTDATVETLDLTAGPWSIRNDELFELTIQVNPLTDATVTEELIVVSSSDRSPRWSVALNVGSGDGQACLEDGSCGDGSLLDFGVFSASELGLDETNRPRALGVETVTLTNGGTSEVSVTVELADDGIAENPGEAVGERAIFFLQEIGCAVIPAGESLDVTVEYRPSAAGAHVGALKVGGLGPVQNIELRGKVTGPNLCISTEDDSPDDNVLQFGQAPQYQVAVNGTESRRLFLENCGFEEDLIISDATFAQNTPGDFQVADIPWASQTLAVGEVLEVMVDLVPDPARVPGTALNGRILFSTNISDRQTNAELRAGIGQPDRCNLVPVPTEVDFGWVAADEAGLGGSCPPPPFPQINCGERLSRLESVSFKNVGNLPCMNVTLGDIVPDNNSADMFQYYAPSGTPAVFSLDPGDSSQEYTLIFSREPGESRTNHFAKIFYSHDDQSGDSELLLKAQAGGSPNCEITVEPLNPPTLFCQSESLSFGNVNVGQDKTLSVRVKNTGSQDCNVSSIQVQGLSGNQFSWASTDLPGTIPVNSQSTLDVTFSPRPTSGSNPFEEIPILCGTTTLELVANSGSGGSFETKSVALSGNGTQPDIDVIPGEVDFGLVTVGCCSAWREVTIYNSGDGTLDINSLGLLATSAPGFEATQPSSMSIAPGESSTFEVRFCASEVGDASGVVQIESTDDNEEVFAVPLSGEGTLDDQGQDSFTQPLRPKVDVLWAVDDSGSMSEEQNSLATNFSAFIDSATSLDTDYHIGVITTDVESDQAGRLYACNGNPLWITDAQPVSEQRSQFQCNVKTTDSGRPSSDSKEAPLQASRKALDYPNIDGFNDGFYREDAKLYVILVTDEEDQSDGTPQLYVDFFRNLKGIGNPDLLNISAIAGPPPNGCSTADANDFDQEAVTAVGGQFRSICTADWSDLIASLGLDVFNARRQFPLGRPATESTITVRVCDADSNGNPVNCQEIPLDGSNGWTFDAATNSIVFNGSSVPGPGEVVEVTYEAVCYE